MTAPADSSGLVVVGPAFYRAFLWEVEGRQTWNGRDWRRVKRERRKFMAKA